MAHLLRPQRHVGQPARLGVQAEIGTQIMRMRTDPLLVRDVVVAAPEHSVQELLD